MNKLSNKLYKALSSPLFNNIRPVWSHHPSSASVKYTDSNGITRTVGECLRKQWYTRTGSIANKITEHEWDLSSMMGDKYHELAVTLLIKFGYSMNIQIIDTELPFYDALNNISGRVDIVCYDNEDKEPIGIEVKSVGEYKAGKVILQPAEEHIIQAAIYLDWYHRNTDPKSIKIKRWYVWYLARSEGWSLKSKKHGSPFSQMWDFFITLEDGIPVVHSSEGIKKYPELSIKNIYKRFQELDFYLANYKPENIPPRDYDLRYSEEKITTLYKLGLIEYKKDKEPVEKWLSKGATPGKLKLEMGDFACAVCPYKDICWETTSTFTDSDVAYPINFRKNENTIDEKPTAIYDKGL